MQMTLRDNVDLRTAQRAILTEADATKYFHSVSVGRS